MSHRGFMPPARAGLLRHAMRDTAPPLDQRWLSELTELPVGMLEFMALDRMTPWKELMTVSTRPSDYFPSSVKKLVTQDDYAHAMGKLRGIAGELTVAGCGTRITCGTNAFPIGMRTGGSPVVDSILGETRTAPAPAMAHRAAVVTSPAPVYGRTESSAMSHFTCCSSTFFALLGGGGLTASRRRPDDNSCSGASSNDNFYESDGGAHAECPASSMCLPDGSCAERQRVIARLQQLADQAKTSTS